MPGTRTNQCALCCTLALMLPTLGCVFPAIEADHPVYRDHVVYQGDGEFRDTTGFIGPYLVTGYEIRMPQFSLGEPFQAEYQLKSLRDIEKSCEVYLSIPNDKVQHLPDTKHYKGHLHLEVVDSQDRKLLKASGPLGSFVWCEGGSGWQLYQMDGVNFRPEPQEHYRLRINYQPDQELNCMTGRVLLRCGGGL